jgi:nucleoside-diphosphate-sugar epimerase
MSTRVLVTGATGVVGIRAVPQLVAAGHVVTAVGRSSGSRARLTELGARPVELDLFDRAAVAHAVEGQDAVVNLATHMPSSTFRMMLPWEWRENDRVRREGAAALVDAAMAAGVQRFVQESFAPIYEDHGDAWIDETWPVRPAPFNTSVLDAERAVARFIRAGGTGVVLRFAGFYGSDPFLRDVVGMVRRGWAPLPGPPEAYWSSIAHEDAATGVVAALGVDPGVYTVCDDEPLTRREWAGVVADAIGVPQPKPVPAWLAALGGKTLALLARSQRMSNAKLKAASGWAPRWRSAREGLPAAVRALAG